jgi:predicted permease
MQTLLQDLRYASRQFRKSIGFTVVAVASLALAMGANTTIFSFANQMLYQRLGVPHPEQLQLLTVAGDEKMAVHESWGNSYNGGDGLFHVNAFSYPVYQQLRQQNGSLEEIFAFKQLSHLNVTAAGSAQVVSGEAVSGNFYRQMQLKPELGRPIQPTDDATAGSGNVVVISDGFWQRAFGGSPDAVGKTINVNMTPMTIIGVNPRGFAGPDAVGMTSPELFVPLSMMNVVSPLPGVKDLLTSKTLWWVQLMARTRQGVSVEGAQAALNVALTAAVRSTMTVTKDDTLPKLLVTDGSRGDTRGLTEMARPLYVLLGLAGLVLLLACANIANLMLARASARQREMSVRMALGAARGRILRQVLTESILLAAMGGAAGLFLGYLGRNLIPWLMTTSWEGEQVPVSFDWRVFGFTSAATLLTGILFGLAPAWRSLRANVNTTLNDGSRTATRRRKAWSGKTIVGFQVALSTLLVISAAFFLRTLANINSIDPGFRAKDILLFNITPPASRYPGPADVALQRRLEDAFRAVPGVESVSLANVALVSGSRWSEDFHIQGAKEGVPSKPGDDRNLANLDDVGSDFFSTMSIPILAGRGFGPQDTETSQPVSVVNQALARRFFPGSNPIGQRFRMGDKGPDSRWVEIVGVCADTRYDHMKSPPPPIHFDLYRQLPEIDGVTFIVRSHLSAATLLPSLRRTVQRIDPDLPISQVRTQQQQIAASMEQEILFATLSAGFGLLALALACVGIYGIMAYAVSQRTNEIGIRLALGAMRGQIRGMVLRETVWLAASGVLVGLVAPLLLIRLIESLLYGLNPGDPITLGGSVLLMAVMAIVAGYIPAHRASKIEPIEALRSE